MIYYTLASKKEVLPRKKYIISTTIGHLGMDKNATKMWRKTPVK